MLFGLRSTFLFCQVLYQVVCFAEAFGKSGQSEMSNIVAEAVASTMKDRPKSSNEQYVNMMTGKTHVVSYPCNMHYFPLIFLWFIYQNVDNS